MKNGEGERMKSLTSLTVSFVLIFSTISFSEFMAKAQTGAETTTQSETQGQPNPMRSICAYMWDGYYEKEKIDIRVSTKGEYDETIVFSCSYCNLENQFVNPFLNNEYQGKRGIDRIKGCGFIEAAFEGERGVEPIVVQVP